MTKTQTLVCILFGLTVFFAIVLSFSMSGRREIELQASLLSIPTAIGIFIACAASFALLQKCLGGATIEQLSPMIIPLLAGVLLIHADWFVAIPLGSIVLGFVVRNIVKRPARSSGESTVDED